MRSCVLMLCLAYASGVPAQEPPVAGATSLRVEGLVEKAATFTLEDLKTLPRTKVNAVDQHSGQTIEFEGVALHEVLSRAGAPHGTNLRGDAVSYYLVVRASDGYLAVFSLPELDPLFTDRVVLLADTRDGKPMVSPEGPLRIVVPDEKRMTRWVRMVETLRIEAAPEPPLDKKK